MSTALTDFSQRCPPGRRSAKSWRNSRNPVLTEGMIENVFGWRRESRKRLTIPARSRRRWNSSGVPVRAEDSIELENSSGQVGAVF
jgi:hypothetical protein